MKSISPFLIVFILILSACTEDPQNGSESGGSGPLPGGGNNPGSEGDTPASGWLIPTSQVFDGGPGKDGIPSVDAPQFSPISQINFLAPNDLVLGIKVGGEVRAYPHPILDWHEIVNDRVDGLPIAITYCPLTGTGIGWHRLIDGQETTFGVSGLLYNTNLIPYDRLTDSNWSQMLLQSVNGTHIGTEIETYPLVETTWATWQELYPNSRVMNTETSYNRNYDRYPYGDYRTDHDFLIFPVTNDDPRLPRKQRGLGVIMGEETRFYTFNKFAGADVVVHMDNLDDTELVVAGSASKNFLVAYQRRLDDGPLLDFREITNDGGPVIMQDNEGTQWNIFGEAVSGPRQGEKLQPVDSYIGYWFSWAAFYPDISIF